ncbi:sulfotransferase [Thermobifida halotolerans]|uniref:Sulfotransferase n=1 Tax=Thermobifida halotolerans TaxID=483545 RepID=A0AA97LWN7_9ACTN|nr:sulfotransferase [Thermobifida halotolerans]UOE19336.1 sulfotransferase [Thermobifida halotolerans]
MVKSPEVFVIGSSRAGTSTLRTYFDEHPQLFVPEVLEPRYHAVDTREALRGPGDEEMAAGMVASRDDYLGLFQECAPHQRGVEVTPAYLSSRCAAESIRRTAPEAQIIAILRHPVERAFSSFRLERLEGTEPESDFSRALDLEAQRRASGWGYVWRYRERGFYGRHLLRYFQTFAPHQLLVLLYDDWKRDGGHHVLAAISDFLGVEPFGLTGPARVENSASPERFRARGLTPPELDSATALKLRDSYESDFDTLETLIRRDLTVWREWSPSGANA